MISAGIPYHNEFHAEIMGDVTLDMIAAIKNAALLDSKTKKKAQIKIGSFS
jgi:hypothetical protein